MRSFILVCALTSAFSARAFAEAEVIVSNWNASPVRTQPQSQVAACAGRNPIGTWNLQYTPSDGHGNSSDTHIAVSQIKITENGTDYKVEEKMVLPAEETLPQLFPQWLKKGLFFKVPRAQLITFNGCTLIGITADGQPDWTFTAFGHGGISTDSNMIFASLGSGEGIQMIRVPEIKKQIGKCVRKQ